MIVVEIPTLSMRPLLVLMKGVPMLKAPTQGGVWGREFLDSLYPCIIILQGGWFILIWQTKLLHSILYYLAIIIYDYVSIRLVMEHLGTRLVMEHLGTSKK